MEKPLGNYFLINNELKSIDQFNKSFIYSGSSIYEVMHFTGFIPLFIDDHFNRMIQSANLLGIELPLSLSDIKQLCKRLIQKNQIPEGNIKILYRYKDDNNSSPVIACYFIPGYQPNESDYHEGVKVESFVKTRSSPHVKQTDLFFREKVDSLIKIKSLNDVVLVNEEGFITEGSRSNIFFIKDKELITPPEGVVLQGITRKKITDICNKNKIPLKEQPVLLSLIHEFDAIFLTSTSRNVLPVKEFNSISFNTLHPVLRKIMRDYQRLLKKHLKNYSV